jgi:Helix-turn-helix domain
MSQRDKILRYLRAGNALTAYDALARFRCLRLAARIAELRECGYAINSLKLDVGGKRVALYSMPADLDSAVRKSA